MSERNGKVDKNERHRLIKEIVAARPIKTQAELTAALSERGIQVTQGTVSRDIAEIPLQKTRTLSGIVYHWQGPVQGPAEGLAGALRASVVSITRSENLVLLKTGPGMAAPVAVALDETPLEPKLGTVAGDDTILVVAKSTPDGVGLYELLRELLGQ